MLKVHLKSVHFFHIILISDLLHLTLVTANSEYLTLYFSALSGVEQGRENLFYRSLVPSCGAVQSDLLYLAQLTEQMLDTLFELREAGQGFRRLQLPCVVQPALQHV